jgi:formate dehydrogenase major subunit
VLQAVGVRGMYMLGENPFLSDPNINKVRKALSALDFLVVQDIFLTETAEFADVILPATSYLEKDGSYTNTDRRVQLGRKVMDPPGQARLDWEVIQDIARRIGLDWNYTAPSEIFDEMVALMPSYANLQHDNLGLSGKLYPNADPEHTDGTIVHVRRAVQHRRRPRPPRARAVVAAPRSCPTRSTRWCSTPAGLLEHWHTGSMTRRSFALDTIAPIAEVYMHPKDAADRGLAHGELVRVAVPARDDRAAVRISHREQLGNCFIPFHFREAAANLLTIDEIDPFGKIPEFKFCAVQVEPRRGRARAVEPRMTAEPERGGQARAGCRGRGAGRASSRARR